MSRRVAIGEASEALVGHGLPDPLLPPREGRQKAAILYQQPVEEVARRVADACADLEVSMLAVPDREKAKDLAEIATLYRWLATEGIGRHDTVVGVGGGAVTDAAGFAAATWLRGVEAVMVPTTLLGAVDAAVGGKTGVNLATPEGYVKNMVGAFSHPTRIVVDLDVLDRLPPSLRLEGTAEILKAGLVADPSIIEAYEREGIEAPLDHLVPAAIEVKAGVVAADFREGGRRAILNFGHTVGHAVEGVTGMPHGHAVAVGMVAESAVSHARFGFDHRRVAGLILSLGLPVAAAGVSRRACLDLIAHDKKRTAGGVRMVLLRAVAEPEVVTVTAEELGLALSAIGAG